MWVYSVLWRPNLWRTFSIWNQTQHNCAPGYSITSHPRAYPEAQLRNSLYPSLLTQWYKHCKECPIPQLSLQPHNLLCNFVVFFHCGQSDLLHHVTPASTLRLALASGTLADLGEQWPEMGLRVGSCSLEAQALPSEGAQASLLEDVTYLHGSWCYLCHLSQWPNNH